MDEKVGQVLRETEKEQNAGRSCCPSQLEREMESEYPLINEGFKSAMQEQYNLFAKKHLDYGMKNIAAGTDLSTPEEVKFALTGLWFRVSDKINRWQNVLESGRPLNNETLLDTFQDIANYAIIGQLVYRGLWKKEAYEGTKESQGDTGF